MVSHFRPGEASPEGGLILTEDDKSRSVVVEILKSLGRKILEGNFQDIMSISRPASISFPMTYLQAACRDFSFNSFLKQAAEISDPLLRIQLVCAFIVSGLHINPMEFKNKPPLNPILGETHTAEQADGTRIWLEQTTHHPPITHWYMRGPHSSYIFHGHGQIVAGLAGANTIKASKKGRHVIQFRNGDTVEYTAPNMKISGVVLGQRNVNFEGSFEVTDGNNGIVAVITFEGGKSIIEQIKGKFGNFWKKEVGLPSDFFQVRIYSEGEERKEIAQGSGSWLEYIQFDGNQMWRMGDTPELQWELSQDCLPSDSVYRDDLVFLLNDEIDNAQVAKDALENLQRKDKASRNVNLENH